MCIRDSYSRERGVKLGFEDPPLATLRAELDRRFMEFWAIRPTAGWSVAKPGTRSELQTDSANEAALELIRLLVRIFYADGLAVQLLGLFKDYETVLYRTRKHYRDHYVHLSLINI